MNDTSWDYDIMQSQFPNHILEHAKQNMDYFRQSDKGDRPWWIKTSSGKFTVKSAWNLLRKKEEETIFFQKYLHEGSPFKNIFLCLEGVDKQSLVATVMVQWNPNISQLCQCCKVPERESREHIFLKGDIASYIWNYFSNAASIIGPKMHVNQP